MARREYKGAATPTTITGGITNSSTSLTLTDATNWPTGSFSLVIDPGLAGEEKILAASRSGTTVTLTTRGYDNTTASSHTAGAIIYPVPTAIDFDEANALVNTPTTKGDILAASAASTMARVAVGANNKILTADSSASSGVKWGDGPLSTKGDLYTYDTAGNRLAVGNNGETLVADSSTSTGLRYQGHIEAGKNYIINGGFDVWQRGTSFASTSGYWADRWSNEGVVAGVTGSQQTTGAPDGSRYYGRLTSTTGSSYWSNKTKIETMNTSQLWGRTVTLSVKLRRNSTFASTGVLVYLEKSATVDAGSGASWAALGSRTSVATASIPTGTTSADWYTATVTTTVPNDGTANTIQVVIEYNGAVANGSILEIAQCQLELGSVPTTFSRTGGTIQGELAACQRYFWNTNMSNALLGSAFSTTAVMFNVTFPVTMRTAPTLTVPTSLSGIINDLYNAQNRTPTTLASYVQTTQTGSFYASGMPAVFAGGYPAMFNQSGLSWSAEL